MSRWKNIFLLLLASWYATHGATSYNLSGVVTSTLGSPVEGALVMLVGPGVSVQTDADGRYRMVGEFTTLDVKDEAGPLRHIFGVSFQNDALHFTLDRPDVVQVKIFDARGVCVKYVPQTMYQAGTHVMWLLGDVRARGIYFIRFKTGSRTVVYRYMQLGSGQTSASMVTGEARKTSTAKSAQGVDVMRASAAGYISDETVISSYTGIYDFVLEPLESDGMGTSGIEDGSTDRLATWGTEQYFWGDPGDGSYIPLVKIVTSVSEDVVDMAIIFNPGFTDLTYGENSVGWNHHSLDDLHKSDHVEVAIRDANGDTVFHGRIDLLSPAQDAPSGYASLGPLGGDGDIYAGSEDDILSFGTSLDDNLNYYGYDDLTNSPPTDSLYSANADYPYYEYYAIYRISLKAEAFGDAGFGDAAMTSVHSSPAKTPEETITVTEDDPPGDSDDPFTNTRINYGVPDNPNDPPTIDQPGDEPPGDDTDNPDDPILPPDDGTDITPDNPYDPPTDDIDTTDNDSLPPGDDLLD